MSLIFLCLIKFYPFGNKSAGTKGNQNKTGLKSSSTQNPSGNCENDNYVFGFIYRLEAATDITAFPDLIWDTHWLYSEGVPRQIAIATAHNAVWCWDWENNVKQLVAQCEEPCILYLLRCFII